MSVMIASLGLLALFGLFCMTTSTIPTHTWDASYLSSECKMAAVLLVLLSLLFGMAFTSSS